MKPPSAKSCPACGERYEGDVLFCPKDGTPLSNTRSASFQTAEADTYVGVELAGQIRIKHLIGIGSMGRVYRAFQAGIERDVAVKILHRELSGNGELVARFHREAKVASRLVHPNVVQVLMTGTVPFRADPRVGGEMYLVMEHLDGISLLSALAAAGNTGTAALPLPRALHIVLQLCDAVGEAHVQGIVHRDLKPENVMLIKRGEDPDYVKVLDFGIARIDWANQSMATQAGLIFGTAKYISPEGAAGEGVGPPADVYSIATILYQCLAGRAPFEDESPVALLVQHTHAVPPELRSIPRASYVPTPIAEVVMQNLAKKPSARAQDARAFGRDLVAAMRASGLDPEEIIAHSTLLVRGAVRLASHARTRNMDMTPELASVIAQASKAAPLPAPPAPPGGTRPPADTTASTSAPAAPPVSGTPREGAQSGPPAPTLNDATLEDLAKEEAARAAAQAAAPVSGAAAILVGVRATDTMVVHASELIDVMPPPLPVPPPAMEAAAEAAIAAEPPSEAPNADRRTVEGEPVQIAAGESSPPRRAITPAPERDGAAPAMLLEAAPIAGSVDGEAMVDAPADARAEQRPSESAAVTTAQASDEVTRIAPPQVLAEERAKITTAPAVDLDEPTKIAPPERIEAARSSAAMTGEPAAVAAVPAPDAALAPVPPMPAGMTPPPPSLRTLFDAPAPEAISALPPIVSDAAAAPAAAPTSSASLDLSPVAPERPGGTQVGPSPFDGDSIDESLPPLPSRDVPRDLVSARPSQPGDAPAIAGPVVKGAPHPPELDWNDAPKPPFQSTMQGTSVESAPEPARARSRLPRIVGIFAIAAAAALSAVAFGRYVHGTHSAETSEPLDDLVEQARECARTRSWDSPPGANVKDITARALEQSPNDARILEVRRESAEKIVTEALGLKYAGDRDGAMRLAKLAVELNPDLPTAQRLAAELEAEALASAPTATATAAIDVRAAPSGSAKSGAPKSTGKAALPPSSALPPSKGQPSTVVPAKSGKPNVPPKNTGGPAVLPPTTNTGPWL